MPRDLRVCPLPLLLSLLPQIGELSREVRRRTLALAGVLAKLLPRLLELLAQLEALIFRLLLRCGRGPGPVP